MFDIILNRALLMREYLFLSKTVHVILLQNIVFFYIK